MSENKSTQDNDEIVVDNTVVAIDGSMAAIVPASQNGMIAGEPSTNTPQDRTAVHSRAVSITEGVEDFNKLHKHSGNERVLHHSSSGGTLIDDVHHAEKEKTNIPITPIDETQGPEYLTPYKFIPIFIGLCLVVFMISLDNTVVATAQVPIVNDIGGQQHIAWLPTTFLIGQASFSILFGQILAYFSSKYVFMVALFLFELGSLVSGVGPNIGAVLAGRTVSGVGAAGIFMASMQILAETTTVTARAQYMGILGALFALSMVAGPLIGGALSDHVTWRWVFYINLPIGGAAWMVVTFLFTSRPPLGSSRLKQMKIIERVKKIDVIGTILFTGLVCMLIIPIQQAHQNGWKTITTWAPIAFSSVVLVLSGFWFNYQGEQRALVPIRLFKDANFIGCAILSFFTFWNSITFTYLIPLFFQTVRGRSATLAGVDMLAFMITLAIVSLFTGIIAKNTGHYYPQTVFGPLFGIGGASLLYFQKVDSSLGFQIGTQILLGLGIGTVIQQPILTVQANISDRRLLAKATAFIVFAQRLGGGIGSSISGAILSAQFPHLVRSTLPAGTNYSKYANITPEQVYQLPHGPERDAILQALTKTMTFIFIGGVPVFALIWIANLTLVRIKNIKTQKVTRKVDILRFILCIPNKPTETSTA